ncbi:hypothetical protein CROQUDRAFT_653980 [Cronartium quercuum f. sp. fusiforme G11]|uniref:Secreted protein n=1 Tax=Cronartium quercuum f. sp. fusiforme G11 TaxID=708437 RepID=A0A9P6NNJ1_9BASI|nr:hypothetical protein CROQUDRAFT_653980 [Cronartium quercuum f. sp. fusiforme G11]
MVLMILITFINTVKGSFARNLVGVKCLHLSSHVCSFLIWWEPIVSEKPGKGRMENSSRVGVFTSLGMVARFQHRRRHSSQSTSKSKSDATPSNALHYSRPKSSTERRTR